MVDQKKQVSSGSPDQCGDVSISVLASTGLLLVRGSTGDPDFISSVESLTACLLPTRPFSSNIGPDCSILWLSSDKWLILTTLKRVPILMESLRLQLSDQHVSITDLSAGMVTIQVMGSHARELMMRCGTLDFNPDNYADGQVMRARFADTTAVYYLLDSNTPCFNLYIPRSYSDYVLEYLYNARHFL